jgi:hypothetical protein
MTQGLARTTDPEPTADLGEHAAALALVDTEDVDESLFGVELLCDAHAHLSRELSGLVVTVPEGLEALEIKCAQILVTPPTTAPDKGELSALQRSDSGEGFGIKDVRKTAEIGRV